MCNQETSWRRSTDNQMFLNLKHWKHETVKLLKSKYFLLLKWPEIILFLQIILMNIPAKIVFPTWTALTVLGSLSFVTDSFPTDFHFRWNSRLNLQQSDRQRQCSISKSKPWLSSTKTCFNSLNWFCFVV